jgi:hypothetical protein
MKSFSTFGNYLFISCMQKKIIIHSFWPTLIIYLLVLYTKNHTRTVKRLLVFFGTNTKVHEMTKMLKISLNNTHCMVRANNF